MTCSPCAGPPDSVVTRTTVFGVPELILASPAFSASTVKLAVPLEGMARDAGVETIDRSLLLKTMVRSLPTDGITDAVITPVLAGFSVSRGGSKLSPDEESVTVIVAEPYRVVIVILAGPGLAFGETVISAFTDVSVAEMFLKLSDELLDVIVLVVNRFCPVMLTGVVNPTKSISGMIL